MPIHLYTRVTFTLQRCRCRNPGAETVTFKIIKLVTTETEVLF